VLVVPYSRPLPSVSGATPLMSVPSVAGVPGATCVTDSDGTQVAAVVLMAEANSDCTTRYCTVSSAAPAAMNTPAMMITSRVRKLMRLMAPPLDSRVLLRTG
jgi:hypothetical protein